MQVPFYFASKAAIVSFVKSTNRLRSTFGIRNSAVTPGMAHTPMTQQEYCKNRLLPTEYVHLPLSKLRTFEEDAMKHF